MTSRCRQNHRGFGAARACNLGALAATGDVLVFLDDDTVPEPGYLAHLTWLPASNVDGLVVGAPPPAEPIDLERLLGGLGR